ncbi:putative late blight resistance protein homolog R1B-16 [Bidens hawaiensis]|uniref:putative late blight resistance protein homolog R1B-16 n=1 Tax=Bidens hawaiensis TaxID=980011 RepID=UPI00404B903F
MTYAGIQMFMEKLNQLIHSTDIPFVNNHPEIISQRHQFQLLYDELGSMSQTLFIDQHQDLEKLIDLKKKIADAAEEAEYMVDLFLSGVHGNFPTSLDARTSLKSVNEEFMSMRIDNMKKMNSSQTRLNQSSAASMSKTSQRSKKFLDEIVVGLDGDAELIIEKLVADYPKKLDIVSIVGMGGIGKTTLATKVSNDGYVKHHFYVRVWVTVSQSYDKRAVLIHILESIGAQLNLKEDSESRLRELVHKNLMGKRYLIVIDDIWHKETWDSLKLFFPRGNNESRILLTSRVAEVAKHANSGGLIHHLGSLNKERSWELLCQKVFHGNECPEWSIKPGMQIVENCKGLPLAVVVIAGVLAKQARSRKFWMEIAYKTGSYIAAEENGCLETLGLSYNHLPLHLRECFLYLGGFPEDHKFEVQRLIQLWVAEGFIQEDGNKGLEDIAEGYLMDLTDRNLVIVAERKKSNGGIKACKVHDFVRELCRKKAKEEQFILERESPILSSNVITPPYKPVRMFINTYDTDLSHPSTQNLRSVLCFTYIPSLIAKYFRSFVLLRVLDIQNFQLTDLPKGMELLVHLRYLAIWNSPVVGFPSSICNLWNLQTLIYITDHRSNVGLPSNISDLVNLRKLWGRNWYFDIGSIEKPTNLRSISRVKLQGKVHSLQKYFPCIKELSCITVSEKQNDFKSLTYLESLRLWSSHAHGKNHITFPATLKRLTLTWCSLSWSDMPIISSLPNLQVLKLQQNAFVGSCWNTDGQEFPQLKFLRLRELEIQQWEAYSTSFPCLKKLEIIWCHLLDAIPFEIGDIPTLELIKIHYCSQSVFDSATKIEEEQQEMGNYDLKIDSHHPI